MSTHWPGTIAHCLRASGPDGLAKARISLALLWILAACQGGDLQVTDAWVRAAPDGQALGAAYLELRNEGPAVRLVSVASDAHAAASFHETRLVDGISRMREVPVLELGPGKTLQFMPGGLHIMLMQPLRPLAVGETITLRLKAEDGRQFTTVATVRREAP